MLASVHTLIQGKDLVIQPRFTTLISQLQSARNTPNRNSNFVLDKSSQSLDCLDALRLALFNIETGAPEIGPEEEEQEEEITI